MYGFRQTFRSIFRTPVFGAAAFLTIALGVGANTAVYAVVHAVLLAPLPFRDPKALVQVWETHPELHNLQVPVPDYLDWKQSLQSMNLAAYTLQAMNKTTLVGEGEPLAVQATNASADLFSLLGIQPLIGRIYTSQEEQNKRDLVLISEHLWKQKFSGSPAAIGHTIRLGPHTFTIAGILPAQSAFPFWADVWMPLSLIDPALNSTRKFHPLEVLGRLKPGVLASQADKEAANLANRLSAEYPATNRKISAFVIPLMDTVTGEVRPALLAAWIAVGLVLLIACSNLAHLMMARALNRRHQVAIQLALGASRAEVFRFFLLETAILSVVGGGCGILGAFAALPVIRHLAQDQIPRFDGAALSIPVLVFGIVLSFLVAILFALPSYWQIARSDLNETISSGQSRGSSVRRSWVSSALLGSEVALSLAVLLTAILLVRSFSLALEINPGFQSANILTVHSPLVDRDWPKSYELFRNRLVPELERIPGVEAVAAVNSIPMSLGRTEHSRFATRFAIEGSGNLPGQFPTAQTRWCSPNYFHMLGIPLRRGRLLRSEDHNQPRIVINEAFARRFFPNADPLGKKIVLGVLDPHPQTIEIVGVVGNVHDFGLTVEPQPTFYSLDVSPEMDIVIQANTINNAVVDTIRSSLRQMNPQVAIGNVKPLNSLVTASLAQRRFLLTLIATFAGLAACLCGIGIYGVFSYSVVRRLREFGIRSAMGARRKDLLGQVARECLTVVIPGILTGTALEITGGRLMRALLYQVSPSDTLSSGLAIAGMMFLCLGCVAVPALRAARVDPATILRQQ